MTLGSVPGLRRGRRRQGHAWADAARTGDVGEIGWLVVGQKQHRGSERLGVGQQDLTFIGYKPHVGEAYVDMGRFFNRYSG